MSVTEIDAIEKGMIPYLKKVAKFRKLAVTLSIRDWKLQYAQTFLGILWSLIQPLTNLLIYTFFFGYIIKIDTGDVPFPLFVLAGIIPFNYFTYLTANGGKSLIDSQDLIRKVAFPRLILPISKAITPIIELGISFAIFIVIIWYYGYTPSWRIVVLPLVLIFMVIVSFSSALWFSALTIRYKDASHLIPFFINMLVWFSAVFFPMNLIPEKFWIGMYLNPMATISELMRWCLLGTDFPSKYFLLSIASTFFVFIAGLFYFKRVETKITDYI